MHSPLRDLSAATEQFGSSVGSACRESEESRRGRLVGGPIQASAAHDAFADDQAGMDVDLASAVLQSTVEASRAHGLPTLLHHPTTPAPCRRKWLDVAVLDAAEHLSVSRSKKRPYLAVSDSSRVFGAGIRRGCSRRSLWRCRSSASGCSR